MKHLSMRRQRIVWSLAGVIFLIFGLVAPPAFAATKLRMQSVFPASAKLYSYLNDHFPKTVKERTNGEIEITMYPAGALAKPLEVFDSVSKGVLDMALGTGAYHARKIPEALVEFGLPGSFSGPRFQPDAANQLYEFFYEWRDGIVAKMYRDIYKKHKVHWVATGAATGYGFLTNFPVKTLKDLEGKKIRTFGLFSHLVKKMGAAPVSIPAGEQYLSLQRGTIDGSIYVYYALDSYKLKEVVTHAVFPATMPVVSINCYANQRVWRKLSPQTQAVINEAFLEVVKEYTQVALDYEKKVIEEAKKEGVKEVFLSDSDVKQMTEVSRSLWPVAAKKSETSAKLVELLKEYIAEKGK